MANPTTTFRFSPLQNMNSAEVDYDLAELAAYITARNTGSTVWDHLRMPSYAKASLPTAQYTGDLARVSDNEKGVWMDNGSQWFSLPGEVVNVKEYGAKGDGTTDDLAAFDAAMAVAKILYIPPGTYKLTNTWTVSATCQMIFGAGHSTILKYVHPTSNPYGIAVTDATGLTIRDLTIDGSGIQWDQAARGAITFAGNVFGGRGCTVERVRILNWQGTGILANTSSGLLVRGCYLYRVYEHSFYLAGTDGAGLNTIADCVIVDSGYNSGTTHVAFKVDNWPNGLIVNNQIYTSQDKAFQIQNDCTGTSVIGNRIKNPVSFAINLASTVQAGMIAYNHFERDTASSTINIDGGSRHQIIGNQFVLVNGCSAIDTGAGYALNNSIIAHNLIRGGGNGSAITVRSTGANNIIEYNSFIDWSGGIGINFVAGTSGSQARFNIFSNVSTNISDSGTNKKYLTASATWDPPNLIAATQTTTTVVVTGASLGDHANASFSLDLQGLTMTAYVSSANTVTVVLFNGTAGPINLGSGTLTASAWGY